MAILDKDDYVGKLIKRYGLIYNQRDGDYYWKGMDSTCGFVFRVRRDKGVRYYNEIYEFYEVDMALKLNENGRPNGVVTFKFNKSQLSKIERHLSELRTQYCKCQENNKIKQIDGMFI